MNYTIKQPLVLDVSHWEGVINWGEVDPRPKGVICKASQGVRYVDPTVRGNWEGLKAHGIKRGLYHYLDVERPKGMTRQEFIAAQAENFIKVCTVLGLEDSDQVALDFEEKGVSADDVHLWLTIVERKLGKRPIIYTRKDIWLSICNWRGQPPVWAREYAFLWVAQYPFEPDKWTKPSLIPPPWTEEALWQYAANGLLQGIASAVDMNRPTLVFAQAWGLDITETTPGVPPQPRIRGKVVERRGVRVRTQPTTLSQQMDALGFGAPVQAWAVKVISPKEEWLMLSTGGWAAARYNGVQLIAYEVQP